MYSRKEKFLITRNQYTYVNGDEKKNEIRKWSSKA